jgi:hypothetical protein
MEFASLQDAFPRAEKKRPKRPKEGFQAYEVPPTDADRPAVKRMLEIPPINPTHPDDSEILDQSSIFAKKMTVNNSLPTPRSTIKMNESDNIPSFFGAEPFSNPSEDSMALFNKNVSNPNGYMLEADFTKSFSQDGFDKSSGVSVPIPELRQRWKPMSIDRSETAFTNENKSYQFPGFNTDDVNSMRSKIDALMARLDDLENRADGANPQLEMLSFIMTGLFLMFVLDLTVRKVSHR